MYYCEACGYTAKVRWFQDMWMCEPCIEEYCSDMQGIASDLS